MRSVQGQAHFGNGHENKNRRGATKKNAAGRGKKTYNEGGNNAPMFLRKTYAMINACDPDIAMWTENGNMFVIKDQGRFEKEIIPKYFDHNKFTSFARQLNFYRFRKMQCRPIRNADYDPITAKHVTFFNEKFQRGKPELLKEIQRSTKANQNSNNQELQKEVDTLQGRVQSLEHEMAAMALDHKRRLVLLEEQFRQLFSYASGGGGGGGGGRHIANAEVNVSGGSYNRPNEYASTAGDVGNGYPSNTAGMSLRQPLPPGDDPPYRGGHHAAATLEPHPDSKIQTNPATLPPPPPPDRGISLMRGFSTTSVGHFLDDSTLDLMANIQPEHHEETKMPAFEQKLFTNLMDDGNNNNTKPREVTDEMEKLDLNPDEDLPPPSTEV